MYPYKCVFDDKILHGGYECGDDGKWTKTCVPSYCDNGYIYDKKTNKCIMDICLKKDENEDNGSRQNPESKQNSKEGIALFIASVVFFGLFLISLILYIILFCNHWEKSNYIFFIMIPFILLGIILILVSTLKYDFSLWNRIFNY